ncbi:hypothetical protein EDB85DRAFT_2278116 [Lactarius pseudohatsudake]|nr:hypothetical protein EDB85DRAFT_2278116 [Lactarius pseudohatsudake]
MPPFVSARPGSLFRGKVDAKGCRSERGAAPDLRVPFPCGSPVPGCRRHRLHVAPHPARRPYPPMHELGRWCSFRFAHKGGTCMRVAPVCKGGRATGARLPICTPPGRAPPGLLHPWSAYGGLPGSRGGGRGGASAWSPVRALAHEPAGRGVPGEGRRFCAFRFARCPVRQPGEKGAPLQGRGQGEDGNSTWIQQGSNKTRTRKYRVNYESLRTQILERTEVRVRENNPEAEANQIRNMKRSMARSVIVTRALPACKRRRGAKGVEARPFSSPRAPLVCVSPLCANREGGHRVPSGVARVVPGERGEGALRVPSPTPSRVACPVPPARESAGARVVFGSPVRRERGRGRKGGTYLSCASIARKWG